MKKTLAFILFLGFGLAFSQVKETEILPVKDQHEEPVFSKDTKSAEYPGGWMALRKDIADKIRMKKIKGQGIITAKAKFIVNIKGKIEDIIVTGDNADFNKETERAIKSLKAQWKPAESKDRIVRSYYSFPLTITFD
ncbi:hypothetical protein EG359_15085 [Chryseobacterium joostei]|uniref:Protein TonB n=1 Tax=Chryseobacterium joostei TaxID=112234 RepID=A0A1N7I829_9FLAO|nr:hypothetical protein [Chryseobacterium joostei]AZB00852.1 hypothetical protein EG359_15085 [Chryseobacterium joostei]SIS33221.1 protein TonB [Chryseobacterium joostei]